MKITTQICDTIASCKNVSSEKLVRQNGVSCVNLGDSFPRSRSLPKSALTQPTMRNSVRPSDNEPSIIYRKLGFHTELSGVNICCAVCELLPVITGHSSRLCDGAELLKGSTQITTSASLPLLRYPVAAPPLSPLPCCSPSRPTTGQKC